ncbi:MAG: ribosomal protein S18-alanine N-acetyltransferase [Oscillospiraceae bacterium]|nr:ribosomal protein S18-alanine N-acetyltransferase [Oscillospiraceae bacterium]
MMRIELMSEENVAAAAKLAAACFTTPWSEDIYRRELENPQSIAFVCMDGERAAGFIHCSYVLDELTLNTLAVAEDCRRKGIARKLWQTVRELVTGMCTVCYLEVRESNLPAITLYQSLGFAQNGYRARYYQQPEEAAVLMMAEL